MRPPRGFRFDPSESELIEYLQDKVVGRPFACPEVIKDNIDVYGRSPEQLLGDNGRLFCFTRIKHRTGNCRDRSTSGGRWKSTKRKTTIRNDKGRPVGSKQGLCYFHGEKRTKWLMKEFTLDDQTKMALCVIYCTQNKCKDQIQGNEWRRPNCLDNAPSFNQWSQWNKPLILQEAIDSESEGTRLPYPSNDLSSLGKTTIDECRQYLKSVAAKTGESYDKIIYMSLSLVAAEAAEKFNKPEVRVDSSENEGAFTFESSQGLPSPTSTSGGYLSVGEGCSGSSSVADVSGWPPDDEFYNVMLPLQESPSVHSVAPFRKGASTFESSPGSPSPIMTSVGYLSGGEGRSGCSSVADASDWLLDVDLGQSFGFDVPLEGSPSVHSVSPFKEGELAEAAAYPGMPPDTSTPETCNWYADDVEDGPDKKTCS